MSDKDEDLTLRDKLAAAALPALIDHFSSGGTSSWYTYGKPNDEFNKDVEIIAIMAYKIADAMRKARLQAFT